MRNDPTDFERPASNGVRHGVPPGERVYAVGDVHGRADLLDEMLGLIERHDEIAEPRATTLVFLGDYVDRGPSSRQVVDRLVGIAASPQGAIFLLGNHEDELLRFLAGDSEHWLNFGAETLRSYGVAMPMLKTGRAVDRTRAALLAALPPAHRDFFAALERSATVGEVFFCHAGVRPGVPLDAQAADDLVWIRDEFLLSRADFGKLVVHGHTPADAPELRANRVNIDTGACFTGRLTCAVIEDSRIGFLQTEGGS